jgi:hypothetical protein
MKNIYSIILLILILSNGCENGQNISVKCTYDSIELVPSVDSLLTLFITSEQLTNYNVDIYLYTYSENEERIITFIATDYGAKYLSNHKPLIYFRKEKFRIFLLTGAEEIFNIKIRKGILKEKIGTLWKTISYVVINDTIITIPQGIPPFAPRPTLLIETKK